MNKEIWKDIPDYKGLYKASNLGRIKSVKKLTTYKNQRKQNNGYLIVDLWKNNKGKTLTVHRLIANSFLVNNDNKLCVNHINGIKTDNNVKNLEWCTHSENQIHSLSIGLRKTKRIIQTDLDGNILAKFKSLKEASKKTGISNPSISRVINNRRSSTYGYKFKLDEDIIS